MRAPPIPHTTPMMVFVVWGEIPVPVPSDWTPLRPGVAVADVVMARMLLLVKTFVMVWEPETLITVVLTATVLLVTTGVTVTATTDTEEALVEACAVAVV